VTEGVFTASAVCALAKQLSVDMPLCGAVDALLNHDADLDSVIEGLLTRPFRSELEHTTPTS
jgi:glycerol-3-phosphate dehydrogenase (NAD(P)+)